MKLALIIVAVGAVLLAAQAFAQNGLPSPVSSPATTAAPATVGTTPVPAGSPAPGAK